MKKKDKSTAGIHEFRNINPVNDFEVGVSIGHYNNIDHALIRKPPRLRQASGMKTVYLIWWDHEISTHVYEGLMLKEKMKPCSCSPNYFLGLLGDVPEAIMPNELGDRYIIAAGRNCGFMGEKRVHYFLYAHRYKKTRQLFPTPSKPLSNTWHKNYAFLAERI